jgi:hypothetical protein
MAAERLPSSTLPVNLIFGRGTGCRYKQNFHPSIPLSPNPIFYDPEEIAIAVMLHNWAT